jgi:hypothetical protein
MVWTDPEHRLEQVRRRLKPADGESMRLLILAAAATAVFVACAGLIAWLGG